VKTTEGLISRWTWKKSVLNCFMLGFQDTEQAKCVKKSPQKYPVSRVEIRSNDLPKTKQGTGLHSRIPDAKPSFPWTLFNLPPFPLLSYSKAYWPVLVTQTSNTRDKSAGNYGKKLFNVYIFYAKVLLSGGRISNRGSVLIRLLNSSHPGMII
jgi:hypothetical protein